MRLFFSEPLVKFNKQLERNKMRKGIIALEDDAFIKSEVPEAQADVELERDMAVSEGDSTEIESAGDQLAEAEGIQDTVDTMADQVEAKVDSGEGITEETAQALEVAVEHFCKRLGYSKRVVPSMEGFKSKESRLKQSKIALENLRTLSKRLDSSIAIAQEGFFSRLGNAVERLFTSNEKIVKTMKDIQNKAPVAQKTIDDAAWGRVFVRSGNGDIGSADVVQFTKTVQKSAHSLIPLMRKFEEIIRKASNEVDKGTWVADDSATEAINNMNEEAHALNDEFKKKLEGFRHTEGTANVTTANGSEIKQVASTVIEMLTDHDLQRAYESFQAEVHKANMTLFTNSLTRLKSRVGVPAADIKAYCRLLKDGLSDVYYVATNIASIKQKTAYSAYKYLKVSTN